MALDAAGATALIGAAGEKVGATARAGAAYVFTRSGGRWVQQARLTAGSFAQTYAGFGSAVALDGVGTTALLGTEGEKVGKRFPWAAYVFTRSKGRWVQQARLTAGSSADPYTVETYITRDSAVALDAAGTTALIGTGGEKVGANVLAGAAYIFTMSGGRWTQQAQLTGGGARSGFFGSAVALDGAGAMVLIGAMGEPVGANLAAGVVYVFTRNGDRWAQRARLPGGGTARAFGSAVALDGAGATTLIGAPNETVGDRALAGVAYVSADGKTSGRRGAASTGSDGGRR